MNAGNDRDGDARVQGLAWMVCSRGMPTCATIHVLVDGYFVDWLLEGMLLVESKAIKAVDDLHLMHQLSQGDWPAVLPAV